MKKENLFGRFPLIFAFYVAAVCISIAFTGIVGCGKKALPLPPHSDPMPHVTDLSYDLQGSRVVLEWTIPDEVKRGAFGEGEMVLSRARTKLNDDLCPECPLVFQRISVLPITRVDTEPKPTYEEEVTQGFRFTYKVVLEMENGRNSEPSNLVEFEY